MAFSHKNRQTDKILKQFPSQRDSVRSHLFSVRQKWIQLLKLFTFWCLIACQTSGWSAYDGDALMCEHNDNTTYASPYYFNYINTITKRPTIKEITLNTNIKLPYASARERRVY